jgi:hypothetical protein
MLTVALLVLAAAPPPPAAERALAAGGAPARACVAVDVRPLPRAPRVSRRGWTARRVVALEMRASLRPSAGARPIEIRVLAPGGHLYQVLRAAPPAPSAALSRTRTPQVAAARLSVAGSQITQRGLYGRWLAVPFVEGDLRPCGPAASFTLVP